MLGFLLGSAGVVGYMLGVPFDIRHIAFSSGHGALAVLYAPELTTWLSGAYVLLSVLLIGFVNFLVSFGLTLAVAITSRRVAGIAWAGRARRDADQADLTTRVVSVARVMRCPFGFARPEELIAGRERGECAHAPQGAIRRDEYERVDGVLVEVPGGVPPSRVWTPVPRP